MQKPHGKGLTGFIFGLLLATLIIGILLFVLNYSPSGFRQPNPPPEVEAKPEILTPRSSRPPASGTDTAGAGHSGSIADPRGDFPDAGNTPQTPPAVSASDAPAAPPKEEPPKAETPKEDTPPAQPKPPRTETADDKPRSAEPKPRERQAEPKPTPEQILNSGNVEKAREQVRREQQQNENRRSSETRSGNRSDNRADSRPAENRGGRVIVQMGSFNNAQAADAQRAKLAMLGVNARVSERTGADGQTVYRIQSGRLSRSEAEALTDKLRRNNIDSLTRSAE